MFLKGKKSSVASYRPVSLTVNMCKVLELIMKDKHLERYKLIKGTQRGFERNKSHPTNLLVFMEEVTNYVESSYPVDVIYMDFQKAFDKVPYRRLLMKLDAHGIVGNIFMWIENWCQIESNELYSLDVFQSG